MPQIIQHIDAIARKQGRDVLFLVFGAPYQPDIEPHDDTTDADQATCALPTLRYDYRTDAIRQQCLDWLDAQGIAWEAAGPMMSERVMLPYAGEIYVDVPFDEADAHYKVLRDSLENPDGSMRNPHIQFCYLPLEIAMQYAYHDEPGFWDRWAEGF